MTIEQTLMQRSGSKCELCTSEDNLSVYDVAPSNGSAEQAVLLCDTCRTQIDSSNSLDVNHWRCLNDSMWTPEPAVQVMAWRMLKRLSGEGWAQDLLDMLYLEDDVKAWADAGISDDSDDDTSPTRDCNGAILQEGDTVTLAKDLVVKGAGFTAKRGTMVKNIGLSSNPEHIEGKVNGVRVVLVAAYMKKA